MLRVPPETPAEWEALVSTPDITYHLLLVAPGLTTVLRLRLPWGRRSGESDWRVDLVALLVRVYRRVTGKPLRSTARLIALLAALAYLDPRSLQPRKKPLNLNIDFVVNPATLTIDSAAVKTLIDEALESNLIEVEIEPCYEGNRSVCDEPMYTYAYKPGKRNPRLTGRKIIQALELLVAKLGKLSPEDVTRIILHAYGVHTLPDTPFRLSELATRA